jgi:DNA invertase Pin-like site-specific DNA recombinase
MDLAFIWTKRHNLPTMKRKVFVAYYRVSTARQGVSGLGLEAQKKSVADFAASNGEIVAEFVEIETGKRADRPQLLEAIALCKKHGYTLCVAKLDRLARNLHFITTLQQSKVDFVAVDNPHATPFVIHILCAVAEQEAVAISQRTKAALEAFKARGGTLGNPRYAEALPKANAARSTRAKEFITKTRAIIEEIKAKAHVTGLREISEILNIRAIKTSRGGEWTPQNVWAVLNAS